MLRANMGGMAATAVVIDSPSARQQDCRIPQLDGLRGFAILIVVIWHYFVIIPVQTSPTSWYAIPFRLTWSGVDLFFVLSGFLLSGILIENQASPRYFSAFYARRAFRILPPYLLLWGCAALFDAHLVYPPWAYALFIQNFLVAARNWAGNVNFMGVTWSLAVEEQFYLCLPACLKRLRPENLWKFGAGLVCFAVLFRVCVLHFGVGTHTLMPSRADAFGVGILCRAVLMDQRLTRAFERSRRALACVGWGAMAVMTFGLLWDPGPIPAPLSIIGYTFIALCYGVMLLQALLRNGWWQRFLLHPALRELGKISYSVYLFHEPIRLTVAKRIDSRLTAGCLSAVLVVLLAKMSWRWLEGPLNGMGKRFRY